MWISKKVLFQLFCYGYYQVNTRVHTCLFPVHPFIRHHLCLSSLQRTRRTVWRRTCPLQELVSILRPTSMVQGTIAVLPGSSQHPLCSPHHGGHPRAMTRKSTTLQWKANRRRSRNQKRSTATYHQRSVINNQVSTVSYFLLFYSHMYLIVIYCSNSLWRSFTWKLFRGAFSLFVCALERR